MATNITTTATTTRQQSRKRQRFSHAQKLLPNQQVEVRSVEEGFRGSWHLATVLECRTQVRVVKYDHHLCDNGSEKLIEFIPVSFAVDGKIPVKWQPSDCPNYRGKIRPMPPRVVHDKFCLHYGHCVDVFYGYAWWEGVVFDHDDGSNERLVFFPDLGDDLRVPVKNLRVTQDWDAASDEWKLRDDWIFLEVVEEFKVEWPLFVSMKQIWYEVRMTNCFVREMKEWACPMKERWKETVKEVMVNNFKLTMLGFFHRFKLSEDLDIKKCFIDYMINLEPSFSESLVDGDIHSNLDMVLAIKSLYENLSFPTEDPDSKLTKTVNYCAVTRSSEVISPDFSDISRNLESSISSPHMTEEPQTQDLHVIESEYCPQAVVDYYSLITDSNFDLRKTEDSRFKNLQISARKHLFAVGWSNFYLEDISGRKELVYSSPNGRKFYDLHEACNHYFSEPSCFEIDNHSETNVGDVEDLIKKNNGVLHDEKEVVKKDISLKTNHVKRSSKRARIEYPPMYRTPRTVLSWLIDNDIVLPRAKVRYYCNADGRIMKGGRVTRDGIKCNCCNCIFTFLKFQKHAGRTNGRPSANIFLDDGRSLLDCQLQLKLDQEARLKGNQNEIENENDYICSVCQYGGELVLCDHCPSSFHTSCIGLQEVPDGEWFCPSCCCRICNENRFSGYYEQNSDRNILSCEQCEKRYHLGCLKRREDLSMVGSYLEAKWFCSLKCEEILMGLERLLGKSIPVGRDNLTWTLRKYKAFECSNNDASDMEELIENYSKLNVAISVMHECFEPVKEARTGRDIVEDVVLCRRSELPRLNFKGVYTVLLEKDDELISTAIVRIYGDKVAEVPLVGTRFQYRRRGMCRMLMHELEKKLMELGVERLVLPAVSSVLHAWIRSFGFSVMSESEKFSFLGYTFLDFQGTTMCHKFLVTGLPSSEPSISRGNSRSSIIDLDRTSDVLEESQAEKIDESRMVERTPLEHKKSSMLLHEILMNQSTHIERESETNFLQCSTQTSNPRETKNNVNTGFLKCYQRRRFKACESRARHASTSMFIITEFSFMGQALITNGSSSKSYLLAAAGKQLVRAAFGFIKDLKSLEPYD